jgi:hypothetical protein
MAIPLKSAFAPVPATDYNLLVQAVNDLLSVQQAGSFVSSSAVGTSPTALLTITNFTMRQGYCYELRNVGGVLGSTTLEADFSIHKGAIGTQIGAMYRRPAVAGGAIRDATSFTYIRRTGVDVTFDLILAVAASTGTVTHEAASNRSRMFVAKIAGYAADYPNVYDVP